jgi:hypothetical protein
MAKSLDRKCRLGIHSRSLSMELAAKTVNDVTVRRIHQVELIFGLDLLQDQQL